ncbi:TPA: fimbria/pilus outer membrane usher protein [Providencia alcalifaciens]
MLMKSYWFPLVCLFNLTNVYAKGNDQSEKPMYPSDEMYFETSFLNLPEGQAIDLSQFDNNEQLAGTYFVYIYLNQQFITARKITFIPNDQSKLTPCLTRHELTEFGVNTAQFPDLQRGSDTCAYLPAIPDAYSEFDFNHQRLYLSIPQIALVNNPRGSIDLTSIDNGINAALLNYSFTSSKNNSRTARSRNSTTNYANLRPGINLGAWRLRNYSTWTNNDDTHQWDTVYTYASRNINSLKSQLILGDSISPSMVFDSVPFRGVQLATDDDMYPESLRGYAPTVRGIARSNAQITIRQNGYIIYQTNVAAGPFEINDLYPTGSSGDLYITIQEADGSEQHQIVPFASLPILQREGYLFYSVTGGQYRAYDPHIDKTKFNQISVSYGLPYDMTVYGGLQHSADYQAQALGLGKNLGDFGAISTDITIADSTLSDHSHHRGQSYRFRYNKNLNSTGTNIALAGYRYSTSNYYSLSEVFDNYRNTDYIPQIERRRNRAETTISQSLWQNYGSISVGYVNEDYWNSQRRTQSANISYNNNWSSINYNMNYTFDKNTFQSRASDESHSGQTNHLFALSVSVPFKFLDDTAYINMNTTSNNHNTSSSTIGISASQFNNRLSWSAQQELIKYGRQNSGNINATYKSQAGVITGGSGYSRDNYTVYYGINGSIVGSSDGLILGQPLGETAVLVEIPQASNIDILNNSGVSTNAQGYALIPYVSPYHKSSIAIDVATLPENTEIDITSKTVTPSRGALVKTEFHANLGYRALMTLTRPNGEPVPYGAQVIFQDEKMMNSIVDNHGKVYVSGLGEQGGFDIQSNNQLLCHVTYDLAGLPNYLGLYKTAALCQ